MGFPAVLEWAVVTDWRTDNPCDWLLFFISAFGHEDAGRAVQMARALGREPDGIRQEGAARPAPDVSPVMARVAVAREADDRRGRRIRGGLAADADAGDGACETWKETGPGDAGLRASPPGTGFGAPARGRRDAGGRPGHRPRTRLGSTR